MRLSLISQRTARVAAAALLAVLVVTPLGPPAAAEDGQIECDDDYGFGPSSPAVYACQDSNGPGIGDDCLYFGVRPVHNFPIEGDYC